ncbi:MAG: TetR/AcrR family transcriptional regulator [Oscillospiraceae bacterium]|nr:TetR/AcrR family transcriptional regulator [Oscillospiraceae bacterium]
MKKQPEITERTRQRFVDSFWSLVREKPIGKIAASELTRRAGYNRSTFYEYFLDTDDLLAYVEGELLEKIKQTIYQLPPENQSPGALFQSIFAVMNEELYLLIGPNGDSGFLEKIRKELIPLVEAYLPIPKDTPHFDYFVSFANAAMFGLLQHWHEEGKNISAEEISALMQNLVLKGLQTYIPPLPTEKKD